MGIALCQELAGEALNCAARDRADMKVLIDRHLAERRALDRELAFLQAQYDLEQDLHERSAKSRGPVYQPDPRQPLVLPREDVPFTPEQLKRQPSLILCHISDNQAHFTRTNILRRLAEFIDDPLDLRAASDRTMLSPELVRVDGAVNALAVQKSCLLVKSSLRRDGSSAVRLLLQNLPQRTMCTLGHCDAGSTCWL